MTRTAPQDHVLNGGPAVEHLAVSAYRIPTDLPGGDATLTWDATTLVLVEATAADTTGLGLHLRFARHRPRWTARGRCATTP